MTTFPIVLVIMGVSGSGKTQTSLALHKFLLKKGYSTEVIDADNLHSYENLRKMSNSIPLNDLDRQPWLDSCRKAIESWLAIKESNNFVGILACSALKQTYRELLDQWSHGVHFIYLKCPKELLRTRLLQRRHHYMRIDMLDSQLDTLEEPSIEDERVHVFHVTQVTSVEEIVEFISRSFGF